MTSGDVAGIVGTVPAALLAAAVAAAMALFTVLLVRRAECVGGTTVSPNGPHSEEK